MALEKKKSLPKKWGAWVRVKWKTGAPVDAWEKWKGLKKIKEAWSTSGEWDCALWVDEDNPDEIEKLVWREIRGNKWVEKTDTHWAHKFW